MYSISWLPYKFQLFLGRQLGKLLFKIGSSRQKVAARNLALCFPNMPIEEREQLLRKNFENTGIALLETGMGWWWPDWRVKRKFTVTGLEHIENAKKDGHRIFLLAIHNLCTEMAVVLVLIINLLFFIALITTNLWSIFNTADEAVQINTC